MRDIVLFVNAEPCPIDLHLHGLGEFDTQTDSSDDILSIAQIEGAEGVSAILLSIYPAPLVEMRLHLSVVKEAMERQRSNHRLPTAEQPISNMPAPARIIGAHLEGPFLNPIRCGALDPRTFLQPSPYTYRALAEGFEDVIKSITIAPELAGATELIRQVARAGVIVSMGHSDALFSEAETGFHAGAKGITHLFNAMRPFAHREPGIAGFALANPHIYVEVIADPYHLHLETIRLIFQAKPANRILIVSDSVTDIPIGRLSRAACDGQLDEEGQLGVPAIDDEGRLRGGSMTIVAASKRLIAAGFEEGTVMKAITENPAQILNW